ncbi:MAG: hypothetical protein M3548_21015 [Actinomycetota bacterium]|nr:hypothetical protein [Actinomycetota bacterium]
MTETEVPTARPLRVQLRPDWGVGPIWIAEPDDGFEAYDADEVTDVLDLSVEIRAGIAAWNDRFQTTRDYDDPPNSGFSTPDDETAWLADGKQLALRLRAELPNADVTYGTIGGKSISLDNTTPATD